MDTTATSSPAARPLVLDGYASPTFGALIVARAKASAAIKAIVKDKRATVQSRREGGRSYEYQYADLADVIEAVEEALSSHELAVIQTTQERDRGAFLVTILAHGSGEWIASEIRLKALDGGPQAHGSELTYLRRYQTLAILGIAPEQDDDGRAAQEHSQARQKRQERIEAPARPATPPAPLPPLQGVSSEPTRIAIPQGDDGLQVGKWTRMALDTLAQAPGESWRSDWLKIHAEEIATVSRIKPEYAARVEQVAKAPDAAPSPGA
jgi:hypothetical protein